MSLDHVFRKPVAQVLVALLALAGVAFAGVSAVDALNSRIDKRIEDHRVIRRLDQRVGLILCKLSPSECDPRRD